MNPTDFGSKFGADALGNVKTQNEDKRNKIQFFSNLYLKEIDFKNGNGGKARVKVVVYGQDENVRNRHIKEAKYLDAIKDEKATLAFYGCLDDQGTLYILTELLHSHIFTPQMIAFFKTLKPYEKMYRFIQIAVLVNKIHKKGYVHQGIRPEHILSTDNKMSDFRIDSIFPISLANDNDNTSLGMFDPIEKEINNYAAKTFYDNYAFAVTIICLEKSDYGAFAGTEIACKSVARFNNYKDEYKRDCTDVVKSRIEQVMAGSDLKDLLDYLKDKILGNRSFLGILGFINKMILIYESLAKGVPGIEDMSTKVEAIKQDINNMNLI